jgi:hypothetical protein
MLNALALTKQATGFVTTVCSVEATQAINYSGRLHMIGYGGTPSTWDGLRRRPCLVPVVYIFFDKLERFLQ